MIDLIKKNKIQIGIFALICLITGMVGVLIAYFTSKPELKLNTITVGSVSIDATEPNWKDSNATHMQPNETVAKDPKITNTGSTDAYVYFLVAIPCDSSIKIVGDDNVTITSSSDPVDLFGYVTNSGWTQIMDRTVDDCGNCLYAYSYDEILASGESTNTLFDNITIANFLEGTVKTDKDYSVIVEGLAIQANVNTDKKAAFDTYLKDSAISSVCSAEA
jgi:hypothetical protein